MPADTYIWPIVSAHLNFKNMLIYKKHLFGILSTQKMIVASYNL